MDPVFVYQSRVYEPAAPWTGSDGWSGWNDCSAERYLEMLNERNPHIQTRRAVVDMVNGQPV